MVLVKIGRQPRTNVAVLALMWLGVLARRDSNDALRRSVFDSDANSLRLQLRGPAGPKRRGRPKVTWAKGVLNML